MRRTVFFAVCSVCIMMSAAQCALTHTTPPEENKPKESARVTAIRNVNVISMEANEVLENRTVIVMNGRISEIGPAGSVPVPAECDTVDGSGKYLLPGLTDMHVHFMDRNELALFVANGVTGVRNTGEFVNPETEPSSYLNGAYYTSTPDLRAGIERGEIVGPSLYLAGHILDGDPPVNLQFSTVVHSVDEVAGIIQAEKDAGYDYIKVYSRLTPELFETIVQEAGNRGMNVIGHVPYQVSLERALETMHTVEHLTGFYTAETFQNAGYYAQLSLQNGTAHCPTLVSMATLVAYASGTGTDFFDRDEWKYLSADTKANVEEIYNTYDTTGIPPNLIDLYKSVIIGQVFYPAGVELLLGTDSPMALPGFSIHDELVQLVEAGLTPYDALKAGTYNAAKSLGGLDEFGTITEGKRADLLLLDRNPLEDIRNSAAIRGVMLRGVWYDRDALDTMLAGLISPPQ